MITLLILTIGPIIMAICGDSLLERTRFLPLRAIIDSFTHGIIGSLSWLIVLFRTQSARNYIINHNVELILSGCFASIIDLDHFITARSLRLSDAMSLGVRRPPLHATSLLLGVICPLLVTGKIIKSDILIRLSLLILVAVGSHHIRDAVRRGLWFPPFGSTPPIPHIAYLASIGLLPHLVALLIPLRTVKHILQSIV